MRLDIKYIAMRAANITGKDFDVPRDWLEEYTRQVLDVVKSWCYDRDLKDDIENMKP